MTLNVRSFGLFVVMLLLNSETRLSKRSLMCSKRQFSWERRAWSLSDVAVPARVPNNLPGC